MYFGKSHCHGQSIQYWSMSMMVSTRPSNDRENELNSWLRTNGALGKATEMTSLLLLLQKKQKVSVNVKYAIRYAFVRLTKGIQRPGFFYNYGNVVA